MKSSCEQALRQRRSGHELHDQQGPIADPLEAVDARDVGMIQRRDQLCFALESREPIRVGREFKRLAVKATQTARGDWGRFSSVNQCRKP